MKKEFLWFLAAGLAMAPGAFGQTAQSAGIVYQQAGVIGVQAAGPGAATIRLSGGLPGPELLNPEPVTGSPFSAARESHSLQVLGDGTRIERTEASQFYRDSQGRTRVETGTPGAGMVMIQDPVGGFMIILNTADKTAQKMPAPRVAKISTGTGAAAGAARTRVEVRNAVGAGGNVMFTQGAMIAGPIAMPAGVGVLPQPSTEDLGTQNINGITAAGSRTTLTIATGEIGNDRPIHVVGETWYSGDLQMVVKSSNSDPRFGDTTFELAKIDRNEPDPGLFQIPADYTLSDAGPMMKLKTVLPKE
jgi:hypothetical protein